MDPLEAAPPMSGGYTEVTWWLIGGYLVVTSDPSGDSDHMMLARPSAASHLARLWEPAVLK